VNLSLSRIHRAGTSGKGTVETSQKATTKKANLVAIGRRIRQLRGKGLQDDFAPSLGITQGQLSKIERGRLAPNIDLLLRLRARSGRPFRQPPHLAFPDHVQNLVALNRPPGSIERSKTLAGIHPPLDSSMVLFHNIV
jgi:transcriptional regulator with XRE-family HTH domain